jgi:uncharacterized protein
VIIDCHFHVWPDVIARRALAQPAGDLVRVGDGTREGAVAAMDAAGIDRAVALGVGNTPDRVESANRFVGELQGERFIGFGSVHPGLSVQENVDGLRRHGLRGTKIHPLFQGYALDDPGLLEILDALQGEFAAIVHVGHGGEGSGRCTPSMLVKLVKQFPRLDLIACHFGGYRLLDEAEELIIGLPVYVDTSWPPGIGSVDRGRVKRMIERHGPERVIYGSDWPMADPAADVQAICDLGLSDADTDAVLGGNLARILGL